MTIDTALKLGAGLLLGLALGALGGQWWGRVEGRQLESGAQAREQLGQIKDVLESHAQQVAEAASASQALRAAAAQRQAADARSTRELRDALARRARPADCELDADSMRQLGAARDRAAAAAAAGGAAAAVPAAGGAGQREGR